MKIDRLRTRWSPRILSVLRIMTALLLLQFGMAKTLGWPTYSYLNNLPVFSIYWFAGLLELIGGALLLVGYRTSAVAFVLSGLMACAYFYAHAPSGFIPLTNGGNLAILFCFVLLYLACAGGGSWSIDTLQRRR